MTEPGDPLPLEEQIALITKTLESSSDAEQPWLDLTTVAHSLANTLRVRDGPVDNHSLLGDTALSKNIAILCHLACSNGGDPTTVPTSRVLALFELFRVGANLCMDHDGNRAKLLEHGVIKSILDILKCYANNRNPSVTPAPMQLEQDHLKMIRTAIGVILNACIGFSPVQEFLISNEAEVILLKLSTAIYPPGSWLLDSSTQVSQDTWKIRMDALRWTWRVLAEIKDEDNTTLNIDILPFLVSPLSAFTEPYPSLANAPTIEPKFLSTLFQTDFDCLEESCTMIEALSLDMEDFRLALARGMTFPSEHDGISCLSILLDFIENGNYHPMWSEADRQRREKSFDMCKAAIIKSVVEVAGEPKNEDILWDDSDPAHPGGQFVARMAKWIVQYASAVESSNQAKTREDLAICATLALGNLSRREHHASILLSAPHSLAPILTSKALIGPNTDIRLKHGVLGFMKNIVQSSTTGSVVYEALLSADVIPRICDSGIWDEKTDAMTNIVQLNAIGVAKHMCNNNVDCALQIIEPCRNRMAPSGLKQILALAQRTDSVPIRSEGTRVLVNIVKSFFASAAHPTYAVPVSLKDEAGNGLQQKREAGIKAILTSECANVLLRLVTQSGKYPVLVNEGLVALSLFCTQKSGASLVLRAMFARDSGDSGDAPVSATSSDASSPVVLTPPGSVQDQHQPPATPFSVILSILRNTNTPATYPVEIQINACSLLSQLTKNLPEDDIAFVKENALPVIQAIYEENQDSQGKEELLAKAAKRLLDSWMTS